MNSFESLIEYFKKFPGIGPRQAKRFAYYTIKQKPEALDQFTKLIIKVKKDSCQCNLCGRYYFSEERKKISRCSICNDASRDQESIMVVSNDTDLENVEKSGVYKGLYFIIGGPLPVLEKDPESKIKIKKLLSVIESRIKSGLKEVILALNFNPEGENTMNYISSRLKPLQEQIPFKISMLGRGLSTGTELEYSDSDTLKNALKNRA